MEVENFLPIYPEIKEKDFTKKIARKKEYGELKLSAKEDIPEEPGTPLQNQELLARYFSFHTPYDRGFIFHEVGTGKTCTAGLIAEHYIQSQKDVQKENINKILIVVTKPILKDNFFREIANKCTKRGVYIDERDTKLRQRYQITTYGKLYKIRNYNEYNNSIIIFDEIHEGLGETKPKEKSEIEKEMVIRYGKKDITTYQIVYDFVQGVKNSRILFMTGTPVQDDVSQFTKILNLLVTEKFKGNFKKEYFDKNGNLTNKESLREKLRGKVSYLRGMQSNVYSEEIGVVGGKSNWTKFLKIYPDVMSEFQASAVDKYFNTESQKKDFVHRNSKLASNFIFSDGEIDVKKYKGSKSGERDIIQTKANKKIINYSLSTQVEENIKNNLQKYGVKLASLVSHIKNNPKECVVIFLPEIEGSGGVIMVALILSKLLGAVWERKVKKKYEPGMKLSDEYDKRLRLVTLIGARKDDEYRLSPDVNEFLAWFNQPENKYGEYFRIIIGSDKIKTGVTIKNIRQGHDLTPPWNLTAFTQRYGRLKRVGTHEAFKSGGNIAEGSQVVILNEKRLYGKVLEYTNGSYKIKTEDNKILNNVPEDKVSEKYLRLYSHCAVEKGNITVPEVYPPGSKVSKKVTNDVFIYQTAENKYKYTVQLYRFLAEIAWDCPLNYARNVIKGELDNSLNCNLTSCNYTCDGYPTNLIDKSESVWKYKLPKPTDTSTYELYYPQKEIEKISKDIRMLYRNNFSYELDELLNLTKVSKFNLLLTLEKFINERIPLKNKYGMQGFLQEESNIYYLIDEIKPESTFMENVYNREPMIEMFLDFDNYINILALKKDKNNLKLLFSRKDIKYFYDLEYYTKIFVIEKIFNSKSNLAKQIMDLTKGNIFQMPDGIWVHTLYKINRSSGPKYGEGKESLPVDGTLKMYLPGKGWVYVNDEELEEEYNTIIKNKLQQFNIKNENKSGVYAINKSGKFAIKLEVGKSGKETSGMLCKSYNKNDLMNVILTIHRGGDSLLEDIGSEIEKLKGGRKQYIELIKNFDSISKDLVTDEEIAKMSDNELNGLRRLSHEKIVNICEKLQRWFYDKGYIMRRLIDV